MCYDCANPSGRAETATSRRSFARFLAAGAGLTVLAACTPGAPGAAPSSGFASASASPSLSPSPTTTAEATTAAPARPEPSPTPSPSSALPRQFSLTDPSSPWVVVNKHRPLVPADYVPANLVPTAVATTVSGEAAMLNSPTAAAAEAMFAAAARDGVAMVLASGYRSYGTQVVTYNGYVASRGQADADTASARPGYSEHQTGWAFDIADGGGVCSFQPCFADQPAAVWAKANGHKFGFVVRYPWMLHPITGYYYEPWHLRYIGVETATDMVTRGINTLEEYFGVEAAPGYP
ncbi:D-alanyl-D-alanine carboxypeptidase family protein [Arthrobacter sp. V1I9]|uniref:M15 family metallopeptidase n=1 Tax=Arthrobacter sp. V1I9 TaxID=3042275 RepID=UPI0027D85654|nr:M15 family metallopeptidase [Arthrobacter sp. V1I9]